MSIFAKVANGVVENVIIADAAGPGYIDVTGTRVGPGWLYENGEFIDPVPVTPYVPESITVRQFLITAVAYGVMTAEEAISRAIPASISSGLSGLPEDVQNAIRITWATMTIVERADSLTDMIGQLFGLDSAGIDQFFISAADV